MILSRSSLWSPLAGVIAMGLVFSMFFTLLVVPVLFVLVHSRARKASAKSATAQAATAVVLLAALISFPAKASAQNLELRAETAMAAAVVRDSGVRKLTLAQAVELALKQNRALRIARTRVRENEQKVVSAKANLYPQLSSDANLLSLANKEVVDIPRGALGTVPGLGPFPVVDTRLNQGSNAVFLSNITVSQPLTQLLKIRQGVNVAEADVRASKADVRKAEDEVTLAVHQLYFGLQIARQRQTALLAASESARQKLKESEDAIRSGNALEVAAIGSRASLLMSRQELLTAEDQIADLSTELNDLLGLPLNTELQLEDVMAAPATLRSHDEYVQQALSQNPEIQSARELAAKARSGVSAAKDEYIPDVAVFARHTYQNGVPFVTHNNGTFGVQMKWNMFDWGKRRGVVGEREAQLQQVQQNIQRLESHTRVEVEKAYRKVERSRRMIEVAQEALALRRESQRIGRNQIAAGLIQQSQYDEAAAATLKAEADELQARLGYELALAELNRVVGAMPH